MKDYKCEKCGKTFRSEEEQKEHAWTHVAGEEAWQSKAERGKQEGSSRTGEAGTQTGSFGAGQNAALGGRSIHGEPTRQDH